MTTQEIAQAEAGNTDRIVLYREGLFWRAYERSAFALCTQVRPFKPSKRSLKTLGGADLVSVGFPSGAEAKYAAGLRCSATDDTLTIEAPQAIDPEAFARWKESIPAAAPRMSKSAAALSAAASAPQQSSLDSASSASAGIGVGSGISEVFATAAEKVLGFDLATATPMECMIFLAELQKGLKTSAGHGAVR